MENKEELLQNLLREVKSGTTYVMSSDKAEDIFPPVINRCVMEATTAYQVHHFAYTNNIFAWFDYNFYEWSFRNK